MKSGGLFPAKNRWQTEFTYSSKTGRYLPWNKEKHGFL